METYFARHTKSLDIDDATRERLWEENLIAVHYPEHVSADPTLPDNASLAEEDYPQRDRSDKARSVIRTLNELAAAGGYVCAEYFPDDQIKVGIIPVGTPIKLINGQWGSRDRVAVLKTLAMTSVRILRPLETTIILASRPRQGTLQRWHSCGNRIRDIVEGKSATLQFEDLLPYEQEVMCAEFLRLPCAAKSGLPQLSSLLVPIGRSMKDIDIMGVGIDGRAIISQVTWYDDKIAAGKIQALRKYVGTDDATGIVFCNCTEIGEHEGVVLFPLKQVFEEFRRTEVGARWLSARHAN